MVVFVITSIVEDHGDSLLRIAVLIAALKELAGVIRRIEPIVEVELKKRTVHCFAYITELATQPERNPAMVQRGLRHHSRWPTLLAAIALCGRSVAGQTVPVPLDPVSAIIDAFRTHQIVAFGTGDRGNEQTYVVYQRLIRDPRFATVVKDIVVEFGNARYQSLMDRYVRGDSVPLDSLTRVWRDVVQPQSVQYEHPNYAAVFQTVREVNRALPADRKLRVILADPPIDWSVVHNGAEFRPWLAMRETFAPDLLFFQVVVPKRRALLLWNNPHFQRRQVFANYEPLRLAETVISRLEAGADIRAFSIWANTERELSSLEPAVAQWPAPSHALLKGTTLGAIDFAKYFSDDEPRVTIRNGELVPVPREQWRTLPMEQQFDAILYVGPRAAMTYAQMPKKLCADTAYMRERLARIALAAPPAEVTRIERYCAAQP
jgi:hypothetical protein